MSMHERNTIVNALGRLWGLAYGWKGILQLVALITRPPTCRLSCLRHGTCFIASAAMNATIPPRRPKRDEQERDLRGPGVPGLRRDSHVFLGARTRAGGQFGVLLRRGIGRAASRGDGGRHQQRRQR